MWYWGAHALQHLGDVIIVGGDPQAVRRLGLQAAPTAARRARDGRARRRPRPVDHPLPQPAAVLRARSKHEVRLGRAHALETLGGRRRAARERESAPRRWRTVTRRPGPVVRRDVEDRPWLRGDGPARLREVAPADAAVPGHARWSRGRRVIGAARPDPRAPAGDPRAQPRERHRHAARAARAAARLAHAHRRRRGERPLLPPARAARSMSGFWINTFPFDRGGGQRRGPGARRPRTCATAATSCSSRRARAAPARRATAPASPSSRCRRASRSSRSTSAGTRAGDAQGPRPQPPRAHDRHASARPLHPRARRDAGASSPRACSEAIAALENARRAAWRE